MEVISLKLKRGRRAEKIVELLHGTPTMNLIRDLMHLVPVVPPLRSVAFGPVPWSPRPGPPFSLVCYCLCQCSLEPRFGVSDSAHAVFSPCESDTPRPPGHTDWPQRVFPVRTRRNTKKKNLSEQCLPP
ncbi:hypothetical protein EVAR_66452_1 [Eumeta japonica]|uniref:Uncharacterized protein n=1 Tax=Eumeta variegata TaxID=151549 RepID=A0A4C1ZW40_EUMVA|nr:hypothetical protein EVAR_66452_1 [Eumeta japonica]